MIGSDGALKITYDIMNVHPILHVVFRHKANSTGLLLGNRRVSIGPDTTGEKWVIMSYRTMPTTSEEEWWYSLYCFPENAGKKATVLASPTIASITTAAGMRMHTLATGSAPFAHLSSAKPFESKIVTNASWPLSYILQKVRKDVWTNVSTDIDPDNWDEAIGKVPVFQTSGDYLLSTTLAGLRAVKSSSNSIKSLGGVDTSYVYQKPLNQYMLAAPERTRSTAMLGVAMFNRMVQTRVKFQAPFLSMWNLDPEFARIMGNNREFSGKNYILYKMQYNIKAQPNPWTLHFGADGGPK